MGCDAAITGVGILTCQNRAKLCESAKILSYFHILRHIIITSV